LGSPKILPPVDELEPGSVPVFELVAGMEEVGVGGGPEFADGGGLEFAGGGPEFAGGGGPEFAGGGGLEFAGGWPEFAGGGPEFAGGGWAEAAGVLLGPVSPSIAPYPTTVDAALIPKIIATFFKRPPKANFLLARGALVFGPRRLRLCS
jgi:hypothetical protein